jgi:hypothetical protein
MRNYPTGTIQAEMLYRQEKLRDEFQRSGGRSRGHGRRGRRSLWPHRSPAAAPEITPEKITIEPLPIPASTPASPEHDAPARLLTGARSR